MDILQFKNEVKGIEGMSDNEIISYLEERYSYAGIKPNVHIEGDAIFISIDTKRLDNIDKELDYAMQLCQKQKFVEAIKHFEHVVAVCPAYADAWRGMAQAKMMLGHLDEAIADCEKALESDNANLWALVVMGNLLNQKGQQDKALTYYEKAIKLHPTDIYALNNIGATYLKLNRWEEGIKVLSKALELDETYLNNYYNICICCINKNDYLLAFEYAQDGLRLGKVRPEDADMKSKLQDLLIEISKTIVESCNYNSEIRAEKKKLEELGKRPIQFTPDEKLQVYAQMRYAPARNLDYHEVIFNLDKGNLLFHYFMHELMHLEMAIAANDRGENCFIVTKEHQLDSFRKHFAKYLDKLQDQIGIENANNMLEQLMKGILLQVMNCGLDMLVEKKIYEEHVTLRPVQVLSIYKMLMEYAQSVKTTEKDGRFPKEIVFANKVMNIATAMQFKDLYNIDLISQFHATPHELQTAKKIFDEYLLYKKDGYKPGDEYDFVYMIASLFDLEDYLEFVPEKDADKGDFYERLQDKIDDLAAKNPQIRDSYVVEEINKDFRAEHTGDATETMMMSMYMLGAMEFFDSMLLEDVRKIAMEIAVVGMGGINPNKSGYKVESIPDKEFGGYQFLAYYYVSMARAIPEILPKLGLPFADAYESALELYNKKHHE